MPNGLSKGENDQDEPVLDLLASMISFNRLPSSKYALLGVPPCVHRTCSDDSFDQSFACNTFVMEVIALDVPVSLVEDLGAKKPWADFIGGQLFSTWMGEP